MNDKVQNHRHSLDYEALEHSVHNYRELNRLLADVTTLSKPEKVIDRFSQGCLEVTGADQVTIFLFDPDQRQAAITLIRRGNDSDAVLDNYLNRLLGGWVARHKQSLLAEDLNDYFEADNIKEKYRPVTSAIAVPMTVGGEVVGVINLVTCDGNKLLNTIDLCFVETLAPHCLRYIQNAHLLEEMFSETTRLRLALRDRFDLQGLVGRSAKMQEIFALLGQIIPTDVRVLIQGESGTGKERVARVLHFNGPRKNGPFVAIDCAALPAALLESELFGYVKGAFTGANRNRKGLFEEANGGTLFLDEIGNMPTELQSKLLRVLQEEEVRPLGDNRTRNIDVRILAATSKDLQEGVREGRFRQDLFYRLSIINIPLPPLRDRRADIAILAQHFLSRFAEKYGKNITSLSGECLKVLEEYSWPGNIRELENAVERAVILTRSDVLTADDFSALAAADSHYCDELFQPRAMQPAITSFKKRFIESVLSHTGGSQSQAAKILGIQRTYLNRLIKELNIR